MKNKQGGNTCQGLNSQELELSTKPWFERVDYFHSMPLKILVHCQYFVRKICFLS